MEQPAAVTNLAVAQRGHNLELSFMLPQLATDGERLTRPLEVEIFRAVRPPGRSASAALSAFSLWKSLQGDDLARYTQGEKVALSYPLSNGEFRQQHNGTFAFAVRTLTRGFRRRAVESDLSNIVRAILLDVPAPLQDLQVRTEEHALALTWSAPAQTTNIPPASNLSAFRVYRSQIGKSGPFQLRGETSEPAYRDADYQFGRAYFYKVVAVAKQGGSVAESGDSSIAEITPRDVFPPAAPRELSAVYTTNAIELVWAATSEPDLAGYNVYRSEEHGAFQKMSRELLRTPIYRDSSVVAGRENVYYATAVDLAGNESVPSEEFHLEAR